MRRIHEHMENDDCRQGVESTSLMLAFRLHYDTLGKYHALPDPHSKAYAFLPVRAYNWPFHIQVRSQKLLEMHTSYTVSLCKGSLSTVPAVTDLVEKYNADWILQPDNSHNQLTLHRERRKKILRAESDPLHLRCGKSSCTPLHAQSYRVPACHGNCQGPVTSRCAAPCGFLGLPHRLCVPLDHRDISFIAEHWHTAL